MAEKKAEKKTRTPRPTASEKEKEEYEVLREKIKLFFVSAKTDDEPQTIPALAEFLAWRSEDLIHYPQDGKYAPLINHAKLRCENWLTKQMLRGRIDKATANLMFKMHFNYGDNPNLKDKMKRSISQILDDIENA